MEFNLKYFGAVVAAEGGDARVMCMVQEGSEGRNIHYFKVDTSLDDNPYHFGAEQHTFQDELRGQGLAVNVNVNAGDLEDIIVADLKKAYGPNAVVTVRQIDKPNLVSLFM